ncbi:uncharacterized protein YegP (UPF0339 family) [Rhodococcus opacus]|nr:uncharacterized protein YegP (UPF0339 family) [Rhodococcus opacus]
MTAKFELFKDTAGQFRFHLKAANGEIIAASQGYTSKAAAQNGIWAGALVNVSITVGTGGGPVRQRGRRSESAGAGHRFWRLLIAAGIRIDDRASESVYENAM